MNILGQLTLRNLKLNRKRTIVTLIGIILSGALICGVATLVASFQDVMIRSTMHTEGSHHATFYGVAYEDAKYIEEHANTDESMISKEEGFAQLAGSKNTSKPYLWIKAFDDTSFDHQPIHLKEGRVPQQPGEIIISEGTRLRAGVDIQIGDTLTLAIGQRADAAGNSLPYDAELSEGETIIDRSSDTYTVTGIMAQPNIEEHFIPGYGAIVYLDRESLGSGEIVDVAITAKQPKQIFSMINALASSVPLYAVSTNSELLRWMGITNNSAVGDMFETIGLVIILLVVIGSVSVIYNAFAISVSERKKQFGMLASVGATARQIRRMVFYEAAMLGLIGIPIGILSGIGGIWVTTEVVNSLMAGSFLASGVDLQLVVMPYTIWVSILFIALTIFLSAYIPAKRASRISPIDAIRLTTDINIKGKKLRTSRLSRKLFGIEGELALKNLKRHRKRYRATVFSLFISIVLYVAFSSLMTYGFSSSHMYYESESFDFLVDKQDTAEAEIPALYEQVIQLDEVERYSIVRTLFLEGVGFRYEQFGEYVQDIVQDRVTRDRSGIPHFEDDTYGLGLQVITVGDAEIDRYAEELGFDQSILTDTDQLTGILVNFKKSNTMPITEYAPLMMQIGESIMLRSPMEEVGPAEPISIEIAAITYEHPFMSMTLGPPGAVMIVTDEVFDLIKNWISDEPDSVVSSSAQLYLNVKADTDLQAFDEQIRMLDASLNPNGYLMVWDTQTERQEMDSIKLVFSIFLYGFVVLIALIGVTNIFNTISTNVALRRREFAMLKSIGMTPRGFSRMLNYECIFYGLKSLLYGLPVGIAVSYWLFTSIRDVFSFGFTLPWREIVICVAAVFVIVFMTMLHSSSKLKKENIIDALKVENV